MTELNESQINLVAVHLDEAALEASLSESLLDHLCCEIEEAMTSSDVTFEEAFSAVTHDWSKERLRKLDRTINFTTKTKPMLIRLSSLTAIVAAFFLLSPFGNSPSPNKHTQVVFESADAKDFELELTLLDPALEPPTASPLAGRKLDDFISGFGMRTHPIHKKQLLHRGIDFKAEMGTPVLATAAGEITFAGRNGKNGIQVVIKHEDGYTTVYSHLQTHLVEVGQSVDLGEMIGAVGTTGASTGPHLHYELHKDNQPINPLAMMD
ncbi:hypothetical protein CEQ90_09900 [Lewinellaceae bacterium SD302]|nr:hypothetical protein CEQ90_09900 [Lewinellaceae bacterium SD302]